MFEQNLSINGKFVPSSRGQTLTVVNPYDDSIITEQFQVASDEDVDAAVSAAKSAFPGWDATPAAEKAVVMTKFADFFEANSDELAQLETVAMGQPVSFAKRMIVAAACVWKYYAGYAGKVGGDTFPPVEDQTYKIVQYEPLGLRPWLQGTPSSSSQAKSHRCLWTNTVVFSAGRAVVNIITGDGRVGALLASHMEIAKISFTGSEGAGRQVQIAAARSNLKRVTLELGGKSPAVIFTDADIQEAAIQCCDGILRNFGQICFPASRVLVQEDIAPQVISALKAAFEEAVKKMGDPSAPATGIGPVAGKDQMNKVLGFLEQGKADGVEFIAGGGRAGDKGNFVRPTLALDLTLTSKLYREELFGPVLAVSTFETEAEAIKFANFTPYGLGAAIYTRDIARALRVAGQIEAGTVGINGAFATSYNTPFGGWKQSGYGRELGLEGIKAYLHSKTIHVKVPSLGKDQVLRTGINLRRSSRQPFEDS
ncbi:hypothetical protein LTR84_009110 [Exophiala bonariae]|uniref:aldehyde dehydrogenase (NAD(+)) n=1 Tax=Exophiala bonariae TaxID=1690606 RepID=A0AAV9MXP4_9EURO|nr:hypothetical protein LTR84_009110 [Exophiala bonariae]